MRLRGLTPILNVSDVPASRTWFARPGRMRGFAWSDGGPIAGDADANEHGPAGTRSSCAATARARATAARCGARATMTPGGCG
jgi:hypothetical protein